jgi:arachidonate 15-lipoxygenase
VQAPLQAFQKALQQIEEMINQRNQERPPYEFLLPSKIPQSINI